MTEASMPRNGLPLSPKAVLGGLLLVVIAQLTVLAAEWGIAHYPLWKGQELRIRVEPVDPRDLFRGNYARLGYDMTTLRADLGEDDFAKGDVVYVSLQPDDVLGWRAVAIHAHRPADAVFLRARVKRVFRGNHQVRRGRDANDEWIWETLPNRGGYELRYGIEAWFAPKLKARQVEKDLRDGGWAIIKVADSGRAALVGLDLPPSSDDDE